MIFHWNAEHHPSLRAAIVSRPADEGDLTALRRGLHEWVATIDTARMLRQGQAANTSPLLRGMSYDLGRDWQEVVGLALAERNGLDVDGSALPPHGRRGVRGDQQRLQRLDRRRRGR